MSHTAITKFVCDRCYRPVELVADPRLDNPVPPKGWSAVDVGLLDGTARDEDLPRSYELCEGCTDQLDRWMAGDRAPVKTTREEQ